MQPGPRTRDQLLRLARHWKQGEHVLITGGTGSGKTALARHIDQIRVERGGHVVVFVCKLRADETITEEYKGWERWTKWKKNPSPQDNRILLWPKTEGLNAKEGLKLQQEVFDEALNELSKTGKWTVHIDEGYYFAHPQFLGFADELAMLHAMGRSAKLTMITLAQRPSHLPLILYGSASHAYVGRMRELADQKRLAELGGRQSARELGNAMADAGRHEFLWVPIAPDWPPEIVNLRR